MTFANSPSTQDLLAVLRSQLEDLDFGGDESYDKIVKNYKILHDTWISELEAQHKTDKLHSDSEQSQQEFELKLDQHAFNAEITERQQDLELKRLQLQLDQFHQQVAVDSAQREIDERKLEMQALEIQSKNRLNWNSIVPSLASLLGMGLLLSFETDHVVSKKALGFIPKPRL